SALRRTEIKPRTRVSCRMELAGTAERLLCRAVQPCRALAPKGRNKPAQGSALGIVATPPVSPERAKETVSSRLFCPFRAGRSWRIWSPGRCPGLACCAPLGQGAGAIPVGHLPLCEGLSRSQGNHLARGPVSQSRHSIPVRAVLTGGQIDCLFQNLSPSW